MQLQSLKLGAAAQTIPVVVGYGAYLATTPLIIQALGIRAFGLWAVTGGIAQYGALLDLGVPRAITRFVALYSAQDREDQERAIVGCGLLISITQGFLLVCLAMLFSGSLGKAIGVDDASLTLVLLWSSIAVLVTGSLGWMFCGASIGRGRVVVASIGLALQRVAVAVAGLVGIIINPTLTNFAIASAIGGGIGLLILLLMIFIDERKITLGLPRIDMLKQIIPFGLKGQASIISELVLCQSGKILAGIFVGPAAAAVYDLGSRLSLGARALSGAAAPVVTAHLTRSYAAEGLQAVRQSYKALVSRYIAVTNFPLFFLTATSFSLIPLWLGAGDPKITLVTVVSSVAFAINVASAATNSAAYAADEVGRLAQSLIVGSVLALAIAVPLAYYAGINGILTGVSLALVVTAALQVFLVQQAIGIPFVDFLRIAAGPFAISTLSTVLGMPIGIILHPTDRSSAVLPFLSSAVVFCAAYTVLGWRFGYLPRIPVRNRLRMP